ncbi:zinc finger protein 142 isoform X2 [Melanotaenia boesemani]|uniref:zinc finger protein 142 isoform X2 n=1 Tax=Melanotaenia boesemani TaxID=1250792 RepID=UPI001C03CF2D|nr:zinc finger protein 142 isoform X2 [Melanotaenia boesemani]
MFCLADQDTMETEEIPCDKCGQSFPDSCTFVSHSCSKHHTTPPRKGQQASYKCSQCNEGFSKTALLKHHFRTNHGDYSLQGSFTCSEQGCQFSSTDRLEYQAHLVTTHGLNLIPCSYRSCRKCFLTQGEMESHRKSHLPFGCFHCEFVSENAKELKGHLLEHNHLTSSCQEKTSEAACTKGGKVNQVSQRKKRNLKFIPAFDSTSLQDEPEEEHEREGDGNNNSSAVDAAPLPSKEYLAEGSEYIYRTHTCPKCRRCFKMRSHLQEHLRLHFPDPNLQCPTCKRFFTSKSKLRIHRLREAGEKVHHCHLCEYSAVEKNAVCRHLVSVHAADEAEDALKSLIYVCPSCGQRFRQSRALKAHMKTHNILSDSKPLPCFQESCSFQSCLRKEIIKHAAEVHGTTAVECRHHACGAIFQSKADMEAHYRTHLAYHCSECDFSCSNKTVFLQHRRHGHSGKEKLCCDFCTFVTFNPVEFEQHLGHLHANEKIHRCLQCSFVTSHKRGLKRHLLMHSGEKPHKCSLCDFRCRDESYLSRHMLTHSEDKNFMCAECGYVTKWKHYLNVHMRKHAGDLRYSCDQCPYRCHRMDQLNSHKLRHQAKSLMCEICAYACKRKYELRNHMLAKHSGEEKQPASYKCKYCTYTTSYRQALQNHENCKHTKLKEFHCALCAYSSFSSVSLFLHKRKIHGYVPGDKAWLENYAAKEKERNSSEFTQDFYIKPSVDRAQSEQSTSADADKQTERSNVAAQKVVNEVFSDCPSTSSPEQYCTLVLTTVTAANDQTLPLPNEERNSASLPTLDHHGPNLSQEKSDSSAPASSSEEDNAAVNDRECEQSDIDDAYAPLNDTSHLEGQTLTSEEENNAESNSSAFLPEQIQPLQSEIRLKAMKKHDKDQAEAMVLEGRVQMLVVPTEDVYCCDKCSYVTSKETALKHHRRALCHSRVKGYECQACGVQFKQKRGLDGHLRKKCPALPRQTEAFVGISNTCLPTVENSTTRQNEAKQVDEGISSDPMEPLSSQDTISEVCTSHTPTSTALEHQKSDTHTNQFCNVKRVKKTSGDNSIQQKTLYTKKDGKFKCKLCSFSSSMLQTVKRHLSTCREVSSRKDIQIMSEMDKEGGDCLVDATDEAPVDISKKIFSCLNCAFKCNQKRALESHETKGCMKPGEVQCSFCLFVAKSKLSLTRHVLYVHKKDKYRVGKPKRLHCQLCAFSCKQERCMDQHIALKHKGARPYRCCYCPFGTTRRYRLEEHESLHTGIGRHSCDECYKTFGAMTKLRQHKMRIHDKRPKHFCSLCDFSGYALDDVRRHERRCHTGKLQHICTHCNAKFSSEIALRNHCKRVHQLQVCFSCKKCDFTCSSDVMLKAHQQSRHPQVKCTTCQESFETKECLEIHQRAHLAHQCPLCHFATKTRQLLAQHLLSEHEEGSPEGKPLKCSTCPFTCRHQLVFEQHLRSHGSKRLYKCTDCEYSTRNKQKITWHVRTHTGEKPYSCEQCSYTCTDPSRLKLHMRVHQDEKKYLCPECGYKCKWATQLKYHMTKHTGEKPYACDDCDYRTNRADALRAHRDTQHSDVRPYVCEKCGKAFKTSFILKTHQRQHSDDRPYVCGLCRKAFRWPAGLRHHFLSHTKQQPFCCRHCSYRAKQKFQVVKHLQRHHPEVSVEQGVQRDSEAGGLTLKVALQGTLDEVEDGSEKVAASTKKSDKMQ